MEKFMKALIKNLQGVSIQNIELEKNSEDVLLRVSTVGLCRTDLMVANNKISVPFENIILGHEFSAQVVHDPKGKLHENQWVGINPLWNEKFMGKDFHGALCEYIYVPHDKIIPTSSSDPRLIAYLEPVAASMAVLKALKEKNLKIGLVGHNRISYLTLIILKSYGYEVDYIHQDEKIPANTYDVLIETVFEEKVIDNIISGLKENGLFIIKSRKSLPVGVLSSQLVAKEINIKAVNYYDFNQAMSWLEKNQDEVQELLGQVYNLENWQDAFKAAQTGEQKKIFIKVQ